MSSRAHESGSNGAGSGPFNPFQKSRVCGITLDRLVAFAGREQREICSEPLAVLDRICAVSQSRTSAVYL